MVTLSSMTTTRRQRSHEHARGKAVAIHISTLPPEASISIADAIELDRTIPPYQH
jgi:hypothetical protein